MVAAVAAYCRNHFRLVSALIFFGMTVLAWFTRFIQDDAFVSFRYAQNLVDGNGLVFNVGERVEGYTNFLWTLLVGAALYLGLEPVAFTIALGLALFVLSLIFTYQLSRLLLGIRGPALLAVVLLGTNYTFSAYATGGLETQLQALLFLASVFLVVRSLRMRSWGITSMLALSLLLTAAILTRPDSVILTLVLGPVALFFAIREGTSVKSTILKLGALILPLLIIMGTWLAWKFAFYGGIIPNTFYAKRFPSLLHSTSSGLSYYWWFWLSYLLILLLPVYLVALPRLAKRVTVEKVILTVLVVGWSAYLIVVGGDFMEFRFLVPIMPFLFIGLAWLASVFFQRKPAQLAVAAIVLVGSLSHAVTFDRIRDAEKIETIPQLFSHVKEDGENWTGLGKALGKEFAYSPDVTIALGGVGVIPYYSRLRTIDYFGLTDPWVATNGAVIAAKAGHQRIATLDYLEKSGVNLLFGYQLVGAYSSGIPKDLPVVEIRLDTGERFPALYLKPDPVIDKAIRRNGWRVYPAGSNPSV